MTYVIYHQRKTTVTSAPLIDRLLPGTTVITASHDGFIQLYAIRSSVCTINPRHPAPTQSTRSWLSRTPASLATRRTSVPDQVSLLTSPCRYHTPRASSDVHQHQERLQGQAAAAAPLRPSTQERQCRMSRKAHCQTRLETFSSTTPSEGDGPQFYISQQASISPALQRPRHRFSKLARFCFGRDNRDVLQKPAETSLHKSVHSQLLVEHYAFDCSNALDVQDRACFETRQMHLDRLRDFFPIRQ